MFYISAITQKVHTTRTCSMTRRNHCFNLQTETSAKELADRGYVGCKRCDAFQLLNSAK